MILQIFVGLLLLLALSLPVGAILFLLGVGVAQFHSPFPLLRGLGQVVWSASAS